MHKIRKPEEHGYYSLYSQKINLREDTRYLLICQSSTIVIHSFDEGKRAYSRGRSAGFSKHIGSLLIPQSDQVR